MPETTEAPQEEEPTTGSMEPEGVPVTPEGNATLVDDFYGNKQLITVTTKAGNYFYILIDRANEDKETAVHFLNQVDDADLQALLEDGKAAPETCTCTTKCAAGAVNTNCPVCKTNMTECTGPEPEETERQGLGTPATCASILEKLVQMGFVERKGKQLLPTKDDHNLVCVLPDVLNSPQLTAEWETKLTAIAKGEADPEGFMVGIEEMTRNLISRHSQISEVAQKLFQAERVVIGKCPRCGEAVYEGKKNYYCGNRACQFVMWKNDRFFEERGKTFTPKIAAALLKDGKAKVKGLRSMKTGKTYDGTVLLADTGGKYVNYRVEKKS